MPTFSYRWSMAASEAWADQGGAAHITAARDDSDGDAITGPPCTKFLCPTNAVYTESEKARSVQLTWEQMGAPVGSTIVSVKVPSYYRRRTLPIQDGGSSLRNRIRIVTPAGVVVHSAGELYDITYGPPLGLADSSFGNETPNISRNVDALYQPSNTPVCAEFLVTFDSTASDGGTTANFKVDTLDLIITYVAPSAALGWVYSSVVGCQGHGNDY